VDKQQQDAWELLRANARHNSITIERGDRLLTAVEEITRQALLACYGPHCFTISN
jgi:hypothetical protein